MLNVNVQIKRLERAGLVDVQVVDGVAVGQVPSDASDARIALQIAKEEGWTVSGSTVKFA